jgi:hypothetical protein
MHHQRADAEYPRGTDHAKLPASTAAPSSSRGLTALAFPAIPARQLHVSKLIDRFELATRRTLPARLPPIRSRALSEEVRFAGDSSLEGDGLEPSVPLLRPVPELA